MQTSKFNNKPTVVDGIRFDSIKEATRYRELKVMEERGEIKDLRLQVPFLLIPSQRGKNRTERSCKYYADFVYVVCATDETVVEDTKGTRTPEYVMKRKLMLQIYGISVREL